MSKSVAMGTGILTIDLDAIAVNWRALDAKSAATVETAAVVKANGYGLGADRVAGALARAGARRFFVAVAEEGAKVRDALGDAAEICVFSGHMRGDTDMIGNLGLVPMLNSADQVTRHLEALPGHPFGLQLDTGMNRLGMAPGEWAALRDMIAGQGPRPRLVMSHLACADEPDHPMNARQLRTFREMTGGFDAPRSLVATGGILLGPDYHFDITRPGVGLYGGLPFADARAVVSLCLPVIQTRDVAKGETVGYGDGWVAGSPCRIATVSFGYADGLIRAMGGKIPLFAGGVPCPVVGRISMDLIGVDVTHLGHVPDRLDVFTPEQTVDTLATAAGAIGHEILTALGARYTRRHVQGRA